MSSGLPNCKITVLKRTLHRDLVEEFLEDEYKDTGLCECFEDGQEFVIDPGEGVPEGFCVWAWADIRSDIMTTTYGGNMPGMKQRGTFISGCRDWLRPVLFKIERMGGE
jgi:uncharacterized repeat protein (TIGR04076 family)